MRRAALAGAVLAALLATSCSSGSSPASIPAARRTVEHWQSLVNEDLAQLSQDEGCPLGSGETGCTPKVNASPKVRDDEAKLHADEAKLFAAENQLRQDEG
jgi:hypothetical protein